MSAAIDPADIARDIARTVGGVSLTPPPSIDEDAFWRASDLLEHVRTFARSRMCSPWAVLGVVMVRVIAATPHTVMLPAIVGGRASLNLAVGLVGRSGSGKGAAEAAARDAFSLGIRVGAFQTHKLGSGQGLAHGFIHTEKGQVVRHADACMFVMHEVDHLVGLSSQRGSTLLPELRSALMGEQLGHLYADPAKRLEVPANSYRLAMTIGVQPARAGVLLDDADGGTPQRLVWLPTVDPGIPDELPDEPPPHVWQVPAWPDEIEICEAARETIIAARRADLRGIGEPLDGHRLLLREKIASALALMHGRAVVSERAWDLAGVVLEVSDQTRASCQGAIADRLRQSNVARAQMEGERAIVSDEVRQAAALRRVSRYILRALRGQDWRNRAELRKGQTSADRGYFDSAIDRLVAAGQVEVDESGRGTRYRCG